MARPGNRIDEELVCVDSLRHVLERTLGLAIGPPKRVEPGQDPPDFWIEIANSRTAVEITSITQGAAFNHHARQMAKALKERALDANILRGTYVLKFRSFPPIPHPGRKRDRKVYDSAMDFISDTANIDQGVELTIIDEHSGHIVLTKLSPRGATVAEMITHTEWEGESQEKIRDLIDAAAQSKIEKLRKNGHSSKDAILALYDVYAFVEFDSVVECTADLDGLNAFAAVYWASAFTDRENFTYPEQPGRDGGFIASNVAEWRGANSLTRNAEQ